MKIEDLLQRAGLKGPLRREIHPAIKILSEKDGTCEYIASDETLDCYCEIVSASGWLFDLFAKNSPFPDSHDYSTIEKLLGRVISWRVEQDQLVEGVQWAIGIGNPLADLGWKMTVAGFLKAVSVGFIPVRYTSRWRNEQEHAQQCADMQLSPEIAAKVTTIYLQQQQLELSACVIGANPNALAKAYKAGCLSDEDLEKFSVEYAKAKHVRSSASRADDDRTRRRAQLAVLLEIQNQI